MLIKVFTDSYGRNKYPVYKAMRYFLQDIKGWFSHRDDEVHVEDERHDTKYPNHRK